MANIRKTFNFRNGVQVDEDNFLVNSVGLVGIGTTVPTEILDVRGTAKVVGVVTASEVFTNSLNVGVTTSGTLGVATISTLRAGGNITLSSGIITASSGVVTFYGDGAGLINIPTSQWVDIDVGLGFTSIYAAGFVGVATNDPRFAFQVGGNNQVGGFPFVNGVGINSRGSILATGIITASSFVGSGAGVTSLDAGNISSGSLDLDRLPTLTNAKLPSNISVSGIITAQTHFSGNLVGIASTALNVDSNANLNVSSVTTNNLTSTQGSIGVATVSTRLYAQSIGIQTNTPQSDLHIFKTADASLQVTGETESLVLLGRSIGKTTNTAGLKFGNTSGLYPYSSSSSLDIINYDTGNLNSYLHFGNPAGINTGSFRWFYGKDTTNPLMTLTYGGNLGIGITNPYNPLTVSGIATFISQVFVGTNLNVGGNVNVTGTLTAGTITIPDFVGTNISVTSGVSTFNNINVTGVGTITKLRVNSGLNTATYDFQVNTGGSALVVSASGIGIRTDVIQYGEVGLDCTQTSVAIGALAVGSTTFSTANQDAAVNFANAGVGGGFGGAGRFMIVPKVSTADRSSISAASGGIIYNTSVNRFQGYNGAVWQDFAAATGTISYADVAGIATSAQGLTGTPNVIVGFITASSASFSGNVSIAGTLTYEDVTNIDSLGIVTARSGVRITGGGLNVTGVSTFINEPILIGSGTSTGTASQKIQVTGGAYISDNVGIGTTNPTEKLTVYGTGINRILVQNPATSAGNFAVYDWKAGSTNHWSAYVPSATNIWRLFDNSYGLLNDDGLRIECDPNGNVGILTSSVGGSTLNVRGQLNVSGVSTFAGITTVTGSTLFSKQLNVSGVTTSSGGFTSGIGVTNPVQITVSGNVLTFTVAGVGSTSLTLF